MVPGLQVQPGIGGPQSTPVFRIRGSASLDPYNNQPLIVMDNIIMDQDMVLPNRGNNQDFGNLLKNLNPDDIENITVLRGGAVTALYGSRAQSGVILITTKTGYSQRGLGVTVNQNTQWDQAYKTLDFQNEFGPGTTGSNLDFIKKQRSVTVANPGYNYGPRGVIDVQVPFKDYLKFQGFVNVNYLGNNYENKTRGREAGFANPRGWKWYKRLHNKHRRIQLWISLYDYQGNSIINYKYKENTLPNQALIPERTTKYEAGLEVRMLKNRIGVNFAYYSQDSKNQIISFSTPSPSGVTAALLNNGAVRNRAEKNLLISIRILMHPHIPPEYELPTGLLSAFGGSQQYYDLYLGIYYWSQTFSIRTGNIEESYKGISNIGARWDMFYDGLGNRLIDIKELIKKLPADKQASYAHLNAIVDISLAYYAWYTSDVYSSIPYSEAFRARYTNPPQLAPKSIRRSNSMSY
ncbi:hypothetical protein FQR65_LT16521 [Abscondita terminalis]|nr:hypothetical protein FQR65_LT16521 [Abscondita terminalis]